MQKNIIICADGTGNTTIKGRGTNVFKLFEAVTATGIGPIHASPSRLRSTTTALAPRSMKWLRIFSGATGWGLSRNIKQLYAELARVYEPGDRSTCSDSAAARSRCARSPG